MSILINAYSTLLNLPPLNFPHKLNSRRDLSDPEMAEHLRGFSGYVWSKSGGQMTSTIYHVLRHIERVQHQVSLDVDNKNLDMFSQWAWRANVILFLPNGSVCDPSGLVLIDPQGLEPHPNAKIPYPKDAIDRRDRNTAFLRQCGIIVPEHLPPVISEGEVTLQRPYETARRMLALFVAAVYGESCATDRSISTAELQKNWPIAFAALSPEEREFVSNPNPSQDQIPIFTWRYEALTLLEWALGLMDTLPFPSTICDVPLAARTASENNSDLFVQNARLRPTWEILDALDLHYRLNWAATEARVRETAGPNNIDPGVVQERHHALNWLIRFENAEWDDVDTPT